MRTLSIQVQPDLSRGLDIARIAAALENIARQPGLSEAFTTSTGDDQGPYVNYSFDTNRPRDLWREIKAQIYNSGELGLPMRRASMAMCTGQRGWDDYLLLFHFDQAVKLDSETDI